MIKMDQIRYCINVINMYDCINVINMYVLLKFYLFNLNNDNI